MSPRHPALRLRWVTACCAALIAVAAPLPAAAYTFNLVSDGTGQHLNWFWEGSSNCSFNCHSFGSCGDFYSINGRLPYSANGTGGNLAGGLLDWTASSGSLSILAVPTVAATVGSGNGCSGRWAAVDARSIPMVFAISPEAGDPFPLDVTLQIRPRLLGFVEQLTDSNATANLWLQMISTVDVDGQVVSADSLMTFVSLFNKADSLWNLSLPKGGANTVLVPGLTAGSEVTIRIWAYMRASVHSQTFGGASIYATSPYAQGPAIEILIRDQNAVDVPAAPDPSSLSLSAHPNPTPGTARIEYALPRSSLVRLSVYDVTGARVATLADGFEMAGRNERRWNGRSSRGEHLAPGVYVVELIAEGRRTTHRLVLLGR